VLDDRVRLLARLETDDLVRRDGNVYRTTRRWQAAMARAAFRLYGQGPEGLDLRVPIVFALVELYGDDATDDEIARLVDGMLPIEAAESDPRENVARA